MYQRFTDFPFGHGWEMLNGFTMGGIIITAIFGTLFFILGD